MVNISIQLEEKDGKIIENFGLDTVGSTSDLEQMCVILIAGLVHLGLDMDIESRPPEVADFVIEAFTVGRNKLQGGDQVIDKKVSLLQ